MNGRRWRRLPLRDGRRGSFPRDRDRFCNGPRRRRNRLIWLRKRLPWFRRRCRSQERVRGCRLGWTPPAPSVPAARASATSRGWRRFRLLRCYACWFGFLLGSHSYIKVP